jgi:hypothetical protein
LASLLKVIDSQAGMTATPSQSIARRILAAFLLTFMAARILVLLIMSREIPDFFLHVGGTHIHHLNYGIFLLSGTGAYLLFVQPTGRQLDWTATIYGVGLALTFDEFGMWLHLGGGYWQRASFDAVVVIAGLLALAAASPVIRTFRPPHWGTAIALLLIVIVFGVLLMRSFQYAGALLGPTLRGIETNAPP